MATTFVTGRWRGRTKFFEHSRIGSYVLLARREVVTMTLDEGKRGRRAFRRRAARWKGSAGSMAEGLEPLAPKVHRSLDERAEVRRNRATALL